MTHIPKRVRWYYGWRMFLRLIPEAWRLTWKVWGVRSPFEREKTELREELDATTEEMLRKVADEQRRILK